MSWTLRAWKKHMRQNSSSNEALVMRGSLLSRPPLLLTWRSKACQIVSIDRQKHILKGAAVATDRKIAPIGDHGKNKDALFEVERHVSEFSYQPTAESANSDVDEC